MSDKNRDSQLFFGRKTTFVVSDRIKNDIFTDVPQVVSNQLNLESRLFANKIVFHIIPYGKITDYSGIQPILTV